MNKNNASVVFTKQEDNSMYTLELKPSFSGAVLGGLVGARIGSALPVVGTAVFGVVGVILGGLFGPHDNSYDSYREVK